MALSAFDDKSKEPQAMELQGTLGRSSAHWEALVAHIGAEFAPLDMNWNFAGVKWGWSLPSAILAIIDEAPKYAEGRGVRVEVKSKKDLAAVKELAAVKMAN